MAVAFGPTSCSSGLVLKSKLLHNPEVQSGFVPTLGACDAWLVQERIHHGGKTIALRAEKPFFALRSFFSGAQRSGVFASEDVLRCEAMCGDVVACAGACSQAQSHDSGTKARRAKTSAEGFFLFLLKNTGLCR